MEPNIFHIRLSDLLLSGLLFSALSCVLFLGMNKSPGRSANRLFAAALSIQVLWLFRQLAMQVGLQLPDFLNAVPMVLLPAIGPLVLGYVQKTLVPSYVLKQKDLLHGSPLLLVPFLDTTHRLFSIGLFIWVMAYLYVSYRLINKYHRQQQAIFMDKSRTSLRGVKRLLAVVAIWWGLWLFFPLAVPLALLAIVLSIMGMLEHAPTPPVSSTLRRDDLRQKAIWLRQAMKTGSYYQDPELTLGSLAGTLGLTTHELSRILNSGLKKSFADFVNGYRVAEVIRKMKDPANDRLSLAGIAYDSGFNSKSTFHRIFKDITGQSPADFKTNQEKELPFYNLGPSTITNRIILRPGNLAQWAHEKLNHCFMFRNYLKVSMRFLLKNRLFTLLNIAGLAAGTLCCLYILLYVRDQYSYDRHHGSNVYRVTTSTSRKGDVVNMATTSPPIAPAMKNDFPEVLEYTRVIPTLGVKEHLLTYKENAFYESEAVMVDSTFFKVFSYHFVAGSPEQAFSDVNTIVLLKPLADKLFGTTDPIGQVITMDDADGKNTFKVSGVVDNDAGKTQINANLFIRLNQHGYGSGILSNNSWAGNNFAASFVKLRADAKPADLEKKFSPFLNKYGEEQLKNAGMTKSLQLQPVSSIHTTPGYDAEGGKIVSTSFLNVLILIAVLIQLIACINFMNLSTARASGRAKEVGVRKVIGAGKFQLITQFLGESFLLSLTGVLVALPLLWLALPYLNGITQADIHLSFFSDPRLWLALLALIIVTGLAAGCYPAFYMAAFKSIQVLKGNVTGRFSKQVLRRSLVVFQFVISFVLITGVIVIYSQLNYIRNRDLGFTKDRQIILTFHTNETKNRLDAVSNDLQQLAGTGSVSRTSNTFGAGAYFDWGVHLSGINPADAIVQQNLYCDEHFVKTMGLKLTAGRDLLPGDSGKVLINETLAKRLGLTPDKAAGATLFSDGDPKYQVAGVVRDFNFRSLHDNITPFMIIYAPKAPEINNLVVNITAKDYAAFLADGARIWHRDVPQTPFTYTFMNDRMQSAYENDIVLSQIINSFTLIAILISCLGLFGLTAFSAEQRTKEIGIRKVLGAGVVGIVRLLTTDFLRLVAIAFVIGAPLAWWIMRTWLQGFAYRVTITWWMFALAAAAALAIALFTVSFQAIRAAVANPVKSLRSE